MSPLVEIRFDFCRLPVVLVLSRPFAPTQWTERVGNDISADLSAATVSFALTSQTMLAEGRGEKLDECVCAVSLTSLCMLKLFLPMNVCFTISVHPLSKWLLACHHHVIAPILMK